MIANLWMGFDDRARSTANPSEDNIPEVFRHLGDPFVRGLFRQDNPSGPRDYELWSLYYEVDTEQELRDIRNDLNTEYSGQLRTIGAWWNDGTQILPLDPRILEYMPDIVRYNEDGNEISRVRPTVSSDVNLGLGQSPRQF